MPFFNYIATDDKSGRVTGLVEAPTHDFAVKLLRDKGLFIVSVDAYNIPLLTRLEAVTAHVGFGDVVALTRQLSTMINAGLPLTESLRILEAQSGNSQLKKVTGDILRQVESGSSLSVAIARYPKYFSAIYRSLVQAGESAGMLDNVLLRLADNLEKEKEFRGKIKGALIYPAIIVVGMFVLMIVMVVFVVPRLTDLYKDIGSDLPIPTKILIFVSNAIINYWWAGLVLIILLPIAYRQFQKTLLGTQIIDKIVLKLPIFGNLQKKVMMVEFTRTAGILVGAGVPILTTLDIVGRSMDNYHVQQAVKHAASLVEKGSSVGDAMAAEPIFPPIVPQMIIVGEATGKLDEILGKLSRFFEVEVDQQTKTLTTSLEPLIMVVLGVGVGFLVWAVIIPIYGLTSKFQ